MISLSLNLENPIVIWHGYLLTATGSNIYTNQLIRSWVDSGRDVVVVCQDQAPLEHPSITDVVDLAWDTEKNRQLVCKHTPLREATAEHGLCVMVRPDIDRMLPVYVLDRYEGFDVARLVDLDADKRDNYMKAQSAAMHFVIEAFDPAWVLINHATPLPAALSPSLSKAGIPFAVKVHGSELEYALVEDESLRAPAAAALAKSSCVLVGSTHIEKRTQELLGNDCLEGRTHVVPPGVDLDNFFPSVNGFGGGLSNKTALIDKLKECAEKVPGGRSNGAKVQIKKIASLEANRVIDELKILSTTYNERCVDEGVSKLLTELPPDARLITFVGKLIPQKGVHLLLAALPELLDKYSNLYVIMAGFGPLRDALELLLVAMENGRVDIVEEIAKKAGSLAGESIDALEGLPQFIDQLKKNSELDQWLTYAKNSRISERVIWLGLVDHSVLKLLWPQCEISAVPSILSEAFGMVAAEAAACGCIPIVADHSGLSDAAKVIERQSISPIRVDFSDHSKLVERVSDVIDKRLSIEVSELQRQSVCARENVAAEWSWNSIAQQIEQLIQP